MALPPFKCLICGRAVMGHNDWTSGEGSRYYRCYLHRGILGTLFSLLWCCGLATCCGKMRLCWGPLIFKAYEWLTVWRVYESCSLSYSIDNNVMWSRSLSVYIRVYISHHTHNILYQTHNMTSICIIIISMRGVQMIASSITVIVIIIILLYHIITHTHTHTHTYVTQMYVHTHIQKNHKFKSIIIIIRLVLYC